MTAKEIKEAEVDEAIARMRALVNAESNFTRLTQLSIDKDRVEK